MKVTVGGGRTKSPRQGNGRQNTEGKWKESGREVEGKWKESGREVEGKWKERITLLLVTHRSIDWRLPEERSKRARYKKFTFRKTRTKKSLLQSESRSSFVP